MHKWVRWILALSVILLMAQPGFSSSGATSPFSGATVSPDEPASGGTSVFKTLKERMSYSLGVETVRNYKRLGLDIDISILIQGLTDAMNNGKLIMTEGDMKSALVDYRAQIMARTRGERTLTGVDNKKEGDAFLADNKGKPGVVTLSSGLQYKILKAGEGKKPTKDDSVEIHAKGVLIDGTEFENTYIAGKPIVVKLSDGRMIAGLKEALKMMPVGSKWQLFIPSRLAYSGVGKAPFIGPNATLIYEVDLLGIKEPGK